MPEADETPDILIMLGEPKPALIVIEAKMFTEPHPKELMNQIHRQREYVARYLEKHRDEFGTHMVALLPSSYAHKVETSGEDFSDVRIVRWQHVLTTFRDVTSARYFVGMLETALARHDDLLSKKSSSGANKDTEMLGKEIVAGFRAGALAFKTMGRGGIGRGAAEDLPLGWKSYSYEVSLSETPANRNWFEISRFVRLIEDLVIT